jgi:hypothetical protein
MIIHQAGTAGSKAINHPQRSTSQRFAAGGTASRRTTGINKHSFIFALFADDVVEPSSPIQNVP